MPMSKKNNGLTEKQEKACQSFIQNGGNESDALRSAYNVSGMKNATINRNAHELFKNSKMVTRIKELQEKASKRNDITIDKILQHLKSYINFNPQEVLDENGALKNIHDLPKEVAMCISELNIDVININKNVTQIKTKIKVYNKLDAIEKVAKHLGFYKEDNEQKKYNIPAIILQSEKGKSEVNKLING
jgi:phage terminase small subunit